MRCIIRGREVTNRRKFYCALTVRSMQRVMSASFLPLPSFPAQRLFRPLRTPLRSLALLLKVPFPVTRYSIRHIVRLLGWQLRAYTYTFVRYVGYLSDHLLVWDFPALCLQSIAHA